MEKTKLTIDVEIVHATDIGLSLASDETDTVGLSAIAGLSDVTVEQTRVS